ncbi:Putative nuclease [Frankliniella fusca]|uniref:Nuclease n=1 Tax=Frankliniella fusca TaxID=407009 RepID=A0AAE1GVM0_9NEOP|nr:Putative nuclease [Frankliniella fusca]
MTPLANPQEPGTPGAAYNKLHSKCRNPVERCNGVLKARWRCMSNDLALPYRPEKCGQIINACVVLHNILTSKRLPPPAEDQPFQVQPEPDNLVEPGENDDLPVEVLQNADAVRDNLIQHAYWYLNR